MHEPPISLYEPVIKPFSDPDSNVLVLICLTVHQALGLVIW